MSANVPIGSMLPGKRLSLHIHVAGSVCLINILLLHT